MNQVLDSITLILDDDAIKVSMTQTALERLNSEYIIQNVWNRLLHIWKTA